MRRLTACNYGEVGECEYIELNECDCEGNIPEFGYDCNDNCLNDTDGDGICDEFEVNGCTDSTACNFDENATDDDSSCTYPDDIYLDCYGNCINDYDEDGICVNLKNIPVINIPILDLVLRLLKCSTLIRKLLM